MRFGFFFVIATFNWAILGLLISFLFAISYGSKKAHNKILKGKNLLSSSFSFSFTINNIIWLTFAILAIAKHLYIRHQAGGIYKDYVSKGDVIFYLIYFLIFPLIAYIISVVGTTFTIGLLISKIFKNNIIKFQQQKMV